MSKKLTDKEVNELVNNIPKPLVDYWIENSAKPIDSLHVYTKGYFEGVNFVFETILKPHIERVEKILHS
jgi:hypothetical protein